MIATGAALSALLSGKIEAELTQRKLSVSKTTAKTGPSFGQETRRDTGLAMNDAVVSRGKIG